MPEKTAPLEHFSDAVSSAGWTSLFPIFEALCKKSVGHLLFSCSRFQMRGPESGVAARIYTNDEANYPVSGLKDIVPNRWTEQVITRREVFVANSVEGFSDIFPDHELIASLGLGSVINLPVIFRGEFIGTVNMLHEAGYFTEDRLRDIGELTLPAILTFNVSPEAQS